MYVLTFVAFFERLLYPLFQTTKRNARIEHMPELRRAAGLEALIPETSRVTESQKDGISSAAVECLAAKGTAAARGETDAQEQETRKDHGAAAEPRDTCPRNADASGDRGDSPDGSEVARGAGENAATDGKRRAKQTEGLAFVQWDDENASNATGEAVGASDGQSLSPHDASQTAQTALGESSPASTILALAAEALTTSNTGGGGSNRARVKSAGITTVLGRARREEERRRAELFQVFPLAAEWGGLSIATLLDHGLLERRGRIASISGEATASAVLRKTLEVHFKITKQQYIESCGNCRVPA